MTTVIAENPVESLDGWLIKFTGYGLVTEH